MTVVHPSIVIHWNTVNMARPKLSKLVMPLLGPTQPSLHSWFSPSHWNPSPQGWGFSNAISPEKHHKIYVE